MHILHYFLGFPPYRTGGLTKFAFDLMQSQKENGDEISAIWPGEIRVFSEKVKINKHKSILGINNFEIINPLPVPLDEGIKEVQKFTKKSNKQFFINFLKQLKIDVIHIHTLMGLYVEFIEAAKFLKIKTVFTSHDYFGICPKVTLFRSGKACDSDNNCLDCVKCNEYALSYKKIIILQSKYYRIIKDTMLIKILRRYHRKNFFATIREKQISDKTADLECDYNPDENQKYIKLREYYVGILSNIDLIHFNSKLTEKIYKRYFIPEKSVTVSISNKEISDNNRINYVKSDKLRLTYLSSANDFKGYFVIKKVLDRLWSEGKRNFVLNIFTNVDIVEPYMKVKKEGFTRGDLSNIFANTDYLLAPSLWYETFGFTVLEALSFGVPVIVSENVGAKDIVDGSGYIISADIEENLYKTIKNILQESRSMYRTNIPVKTWNMFLQECYRIYEKI